MTEYGYLFLIFLQKILALLLVPYFWWTSRRPVKIVPKIDNPILFYSASALADKIRKKEITSQEVIQAYVLRIKSVDPIIKAVVQDRFEQALIEAHNVDEYLKTCTLTEDELRLKYPLLGVPLTVKESCKLQGMSYSVGSKKRLGITAKTDGVVVKRLREAGAIPLSVSNTPELCLFWEASNKLREKTCNPYNTNRTSAGSSGGEGSLLGCGASVIGIGSDVAGSIRLPAMFNGVYGHKPTPRIIPIEGHYPSSTNDILKDFLVVGPMTRYAEDLQLMTQIISDKNPDLNFEEIDLKKINVYFEYEVEKSVFVTRVHKDIKRAIYTSVECLKQNAKVTVKDLKFDLSNCCEMCLSILYDMEDIPNVLREPASTKKEKNLYVEILKSLLGCSDHSLQGLFFYALQRTNVFIPKSRSAYYKTKASLLKRDFLEKLSDNGVFLLPTYPTSAVQHNKMFVETNNVLYMLLFNMLGFPATHVPLGRDNEGLPIGIQVVAGPFQDKLCFAVAKELERHFGALLPVPYFWWTSRRPAKIVSKIDNPILFFSTSALADKIRKKEITSQEVIQAYVLRVKSVDPIIKAVVQDRFEQALIEAHNVDEYLKTCTLTEDELRLKYPLLGVPLTVKESYRLQGMSYSVGSKKRLGITAKTDGVVVKRLREAGAIPLSVSNTPELCLFWEGSNKLREKTCNPYNTNRTSAGSSGGEGSLLGCGASVIGIGSDVAGSIRLPAMFNGVYGHKPTPRIIPIEGHYPSSTNDILKDFLVVGPMTRYPEDLQLMTQIISDKNPDLNFEEIDLKEINVFFEYEVEKSIFVTRVHKDIKRAIYTSVECLKQNAKVTVKDFKFDLSNCCEMCLSILYDMEDIPNVLREPASTKKEKNLYVEILKSLLGCSDHSLQGLFFYALQRTNVFIPKSRSAYYKTKASLLKRDFSEKLSDNGVFLLPTYPTSAVQHNKMFVETNNVLYMLLFNMLGFPAIHVPLGRDNEGLPIGIQVVAGLFQDKLCFAVAKELERHFGGWTEP